MRILSLLLLVIALSFGFEALAQKPPEKVVFQAKMGNVTFDHAAHVKRANANCKTCHESLFKQSSTEPINFKANLHKTAETGKTSCGFCHNPGGPSFETKGNCAKCHVK
jgi:c(7)-type cytochrome triheme protein